MSLILFLKIPEKGKVKTRLAARVGEEKALEIYEGLLRHTLEVAMELPLRRLIFFFRRSQFLAARLVAGGCLFVFPPAGQ